MNYLSTLTRAIIIAAEAHDGQFDKGGHPYILHPLRVMMNLSNEDERIVAVLHDVIEDTKVSSSDLYNEGFSIEIIEAIDCLSRNGLETYEEFIIRVKKNALSTKVKIKDILDNLDLSRIPNRTVKDDVRAQKYLDALAVLTM